MTKIISKSIKIFSTYMSRDSLKIWKSKIYKNYIHIFCLQSKCFVCIHKHYSVDAWKEFAAANEGILEVSQDYVVNYIAIDKTSTSIFKKFQTTFIEENKELSESMDMMHCKFSANHTKMFPKSVLLREIQYIREHNQMIVIIKNRS